MVQLPMTSCKYAYINIPACDLTRRAQLPAHLGRHAVESSIAVEDVVENRCLYRVFVSRLF